LSWESSERHGEVCRLYRTLYRTAPERWLDKLALVDATRLDAQLNPAPLCSKVPALAAGDLGCAGFARRGRLMVIELKASEDIQLPIQAVDYWLRVRGHQREGDFEQFGATSPAWNSTGNPRSCG
jgi:hypothetical protein